MQLFHKAFLLFLLISVVVSSMVSADAMDDSDRQAQVAGERTARAANSIPYNVGYVAEKTRQKVRKTVRLPIYIARKMGRNIRGFFRGFGDIARKGAIRADQDN